MEERPVALLAAVLRGRPATGELVGRPEPFSIQLDAASTILRLVDGGSAVPHAGRLLWDWLVGPTPRKAAPFASQDYWEFVLRLLRWTCTKQKHGAAVGVKSQLTMSFTSAVDSDRSATLEANVLRPFIAALELYYDIASVALEDTVEITVGLCRFAASAAAQPGLVDPLAEALTMCSRQLRKASSLHRNPRKAFGLACTRLLPVSTQTEGAAAAATAAPVASAAALVTQETVSMLTASDHIQFYRGAVTPGTGGSASNNDTRDTRSYPRQLFITLRELTQLSDDVVREKVLASVPIIFDAFAQGSQNAFAKSTNRVRFDVFVHLTKSVGFDTGSPSETAKFCDNHLLECVNSLLGKMLAHSIYNETDDTSTGGSMLQWFSNAGTILAECTSDGRHAVAYSTLSRLLVLNHAAVENRLPKLVRTSWMLGNTATQDVDEFLIQAITVYSKLRQLDALIRIIAEAVDNESASTQCTLSARVIEAFAFAVQELPDGQITLISDVFLDVTPQIQLEPPRISQTEKKSKRRRSQKTSEAPLSIAIVELFHVYLLNCAVLPHQVQPTTKFLISVKNEILEPALVRGGVETPATVLYLALAWCELAFLTWRVGGENNGDMPVLTAPVLAQLFDTPLAESYPTQQLLFRLLGLQRLVFHRSMFGLPNVDSGDVRATERIIDAVYNCLKAGVISGSTEAQPIRPGFSSPESLGAAAWIAIVDNLPLVVSCVSIDSIRVLATIFVAVACSEPSGPSTTTLYTVTTDLFLHASTHELSRLTAVILRQALTTIGACADHLLASSDASNTFQSVVKSDAVRTAECEDADNRFPWLPSTHGLNKDEVEANLRPWCEGAIALVRATNLTTVAVEELHAYCGGLLALDTAVSTECERIDGQHSNVIQDLQLWCESLTSTAARSVPQAFVVNLLGPKMEPTLTRYAKTAGTSDVATQILSVFFQHAPFDEMRWSARPKWEKRVKKRTSAVASIAVQCITDWKENEDSDPTAERRALSAALAIFSGLSSAADHGKSRVKDEITVIWSCCTVLAEALCSKLSQTKGPMGVVAVELLVSLSKLGKYVGDERYSIERVNRAENLAHVLQLRYESESGVPVLSAGWHKYVDFIGESAASLDAIEFNLLVAVEFAGLMVDDNGLPDAIATQTATHGVIHLVRECTASQFTEILKFVRTEIHRGCASPKLILARQSRPAAAVALLRALVEELPRSPHTSTMNAFLRKVETQLLELIEVSASFETQSKGLSLSRCILRCIEQHILLRTASVNPWRCGVLLQIVAASPCALKAWRELRTNDSESAHALELFRAQAAVLEGLIRRHSKALMPCVAAFVAVIRTLLSFVVVLGAEKDVPLDVAAGLARSLSRLFELFAVLPSASKHAPFMLVDILSLFERFTLRPSVRTAVIPGVHALLGACGTYEVELVGALASDSSKTIFEALHTEFQKYFKYKGKA